MVPVRTIIPKNGGTSAVISAPSCVPDGQGATPSNGGSTRLQPGIHGRPQTKCHEITIGLPGMAVTYDLKRAGR